MTIQIEEQYYQDNTLKIRIYSDNGNRHREDGPSNERFNRDGTLLYQGWSYQGEPHRIDGPTHERFYKDGTPESRQWYRYGERHRDDGPAYEDFNEAGICLDAEFWLDDMYILPGDYHRQVLLRKLQRKTGSEMGGSL